MVPERGGNHDCLSGFTVDVGHVGDFVEGVYVEGGPTVKFSLSEAAGVIALLR